jgi:hypothetical protein
MLNDFIKWCRYYNVEITWFIIGFLLSIGIDELSEGNYASAIFNLALAYINFVCYKKDYT